jgi:hypothetical protein
MNNRAVCIACEKTKYCSKNYGKLHGSNESFG